MTASRMARTTRRTRLRAGCAALVMASAIGGWLSAPVRGAQTFELVSAQAVSAGGQQPSTLRLAANGPIAFHRLGEDEGGAPESGGLVRVRLYGVRPGHLATGDGLQPFIVTTQGTGDDTIATIALSGADAQTRLVIRPGQRANEIEIVSSRAS